MVTKQSAVNSALPQIPDELLEQWSGKIKTEQDLTGFMSILMKQMVERSLKAELTEHLEVKASSSIPTAKMATQARRLKARLASYPSKRHATAKARLSRYWCAKS